MNILLGVSGSVAAVYTTQLMKELKKYGKVKTVLTRVADEFSHVEHVYADVYTDADEHWKKLGDPILHIDLRNWADVMVIAPLSANTMAKIVGGYCDNLLTETVRAWDFSKPIIICPAMNTLMWENEPTESQIRTLKERGYEVIDPVVKTLACGDVGTGAMCEHVSIINRIDDLRWSKPLENFSFVPTGTHPGAFGAVRKHDVHTGVDLYCEDGDIVSAMEDGVVVYNDMFTGPQIGMPWWNTTYGLKIQGKSGVINYGEINNTGWEPGDKVQRGARLGQVVAVLNEDKIRPDIPHHSNAMLHIELYKPSMMDYSWAMWELRQEKPKYLLNPTSRLENVK